jgi:hypothetical protein
VTVVEGGDGVQEGGGAAEPTTAPRCGRPRTARPAAAPRRQELEVVDVEEAVVDAEVQRRSRRHIRATAARVNRRVAALGSTGDGRTAGVN